MASSLPLPSPDLAAPPPSPPAFGAPARAEWALEPGQRFLNHGSFGACPRRVLAVQRAWQDRLEAQPVRLMAEELQPALRAAATRLGQFLNVPGDSLAFVDNATTGVWSVLASRPWRRGDRIVCTDHIYNAVAVQLALLATRHGVEIDILPLGMPAPDAAVILGMVDRALARGAALLLVDHVASASALRLPLAELIACAHARAVPVLVDGAHGPGLLNLDLAGLQADWYAGNCHKWLCAPKGAGFLHARPDRRDGLLPPVPSHPAADGFPAAFDWVGTRDFSAWLTVPAAIDFHQWLGGSRLRERNRGLAQQSAITLADALGCDLGAAPDQFEAMATVALPFALPGTRVAAAALRKAIWDRDRVELAITALADRLWARLSVQAYNDDADYQDLAPILRRAAAALA